ncbi:MAG TPA: type II toxin-antitoxin system prevent-host-death family antitoxin [Novosphingobium sp.]|nr:type II toxin-antitoxin system prevent-host-death family antitoxin [Novosphingobium sp.]
MDTVNIHEAKTHLSRLIERVASSGGFIIAKAGKPVAKIVPLNVPDCGKVKRLGFMAGQLRVPADFDRMGEQEIEALFGGQS